MDIQKINRRNSLNETLIKLHGKKADIFKTLGKDFYAEMLRHRGEKNTEKTFETLIGLFILAENQIEDINDRMFYNEKELKFLESEIERIGKKEKIAEEKMTKFVDKLNQLNKPNGEKRDEIQRRQKKRYT
jgi:chromosome segregation ATPase